MSELEFIDSDTLCGELASRCEDLVIIERRREKVGDDRRIVVRYTAEDSEAARTCRLAATMLDEPGDQDEPSDGTILDSD